VVRDRNIVVSVKDGVASVVIDRPAARNAMSFAMYDALASACRSFNADPKIRVATFRGGGKAFAAGTDISEFLAFRTGKDGVTYEIMIEASLQALADVKVPTIAVIEGHAVGGGLMLAQACDIRIATPGARFGIPVARTLGNCITTRDLTRLAGEFGVSRVRRMMYLAELIDAEEARTAGFLAKIVEPERLEEATAALCQQVAAYAPVTLRTAKKQFQRSASGLYEDNDLLEACYASADFHEGVAAFRAKRAPHWQGS
jgi:enoyl-CoA hydratase